MSNYLQLNQSKAVSQLHDGATGLRAENTEDFFSRCYDDGWDIEEASDWITIAERADPTFQIVDVSTNMSWWKVKNQGPIGSCWGVSGAQVKTAQHYVESGGELIDFSGFMNYLWAQMVGGGLGRDNGSLPSAGVKVYKDIGFLPAKHAPRYPGSYREGYRSHKNLLKDPEIRKLAAPYRINKMLRVRSTEEIVKCYELGQGFVQIWSKWTQEMDRQSEQITAFRSPGSGGRHAGGHAYQAPALTPGKNPVIGNTWGERWGVDGTKRMARNAMDDLFEDSMSGAVILVANSTPPGPRRIPEFVSSDWM